ncbi:hypothetical protein [Rhodococcus sp. B50]|uniref:hypothetical protein n=1 Tax=Rhodococcus sp. B50 TaxID=2682847 RepID=UPI0035ABBD49|nr:hypothetical protein [Rhodococcus sp. B50]
MADRGRNQRGTVLGLGSTVANTDQASALYGIFPTLGVITVIWLITGPVWVLGKQ